MKKLAILLICGLLPGFLIAQTTTQWLVEGEHSGFDSILDAVYDEDGNVYAIGACRFSGPLTVGPFTYNMSQIGAIYLAKIALSGNVLWLEVFEGRRAEQPKIAYDAGHLYIAGQYRDSIQLGSFQLKNPNIRQFLSAVDTSGSV